MLVSREKSNPIIRPEDIAPLSNDFEVIGVFNPGVTTYKGQTLLLLRIAERPKDRHDGKLRVPVFIRDENRIGLLDFDLSDKNYDFSDCRVVKRNDGKRFLTSFSSFLPATSADGVHFSVAGERILPANEFEAFGIEDARITQIDGAYYINYTAASDAGIVTSLMRTVDFVTYERLGNIMSPDNKDVSLFPEKINGEYYALHRPSTSEFGKPEVWIARSPNLICWGDHKRVMSVSENEWDSVRIGSSSAPIKTEYGWLLVYHGANHRNVYQLGAVLLDLNQPWKVLARTERPIMSPTAAYEKNGFLCDVIFACGCVNRPDYLEIYYGAADQYVCKATVRKDDILNELGVFRPASAAEEPFRALKTAL